MKALTIIKRPYVDLPKIAKRIPMSEAQELTSQLEAIAERAAAMSAYLQEALGTYGCGKKEHSDCLKAFNNTLKKVRSAMGFNMTRPLSF